MAKVRVFENLHFEYMEAKRRFLEAKRDFGCKQNEVRSSLFGMYSEWCYGRFGFVLRPCVDFIGCAEENPVELFFEENDVSPLLRDLVIKLLTQTFEERQKEQLQC